MLRIIRHNVDDISQGKTVYEDGRLMLDFDRLRRLIEEDKRIVHTRLHLVRPGERTRVANVLDVFEARKKVDGPTYPGFDGPPLPSGSGDLHIFDNFQIVGSAEMPSGGGGVRVARRAFLDFWGEGSRWSPFSTNNSLVVEMTLDPALEDQQAADDAVRRALVTASAAIGAIGSNAPESTSEIQELPARWEREERDDLPRVAYVYQIQSHGAVLNTYLYGTPLDGLYPTVIDPTELFDGALVSGNRGRMTTPTILHCNNPVLRRMIAEDGETLTLLPVVLMEGHHKTTPEKQRSSYHAAQLLRTLRADGAVLTQEGGGMSIVDQMLTIDAARASGIECVGLTYEMAGTNGADRPLIHYTRAATNLVSTGNRDELVDLEAPTALVGAGTNDSNDGEHDASTQPDLPSDQSHPDSTDTGKDDRRSTETSESVDLSSAVKVPVWCLYGSVTQVGAGRVRGHDSTKVMV